MIRRTLATAVTLACATCAVCGTAAGGERLWPGESLSGQTALRPPEEFHLAIAPLPAEEALLGEALLPPPAAPEPFDELTRRVLEMEAALAGLSDQLEAATRRPPPPAFPRIRGHLFFDAAAFGQDAADRQRHDEQDGVTCRVARLVAEGTVAETMPYKLEVDFAAPTIVDAWIGIRDLPLLGNFRVGHFKEPFSLEQVPSRKYYVFMERSLAEAIHRPPRRWGLMAFDTAAEERITWAAGLFAEGAGVNFVQDDDFGGAFTARVTALPWYDASDAGRRLVHTGLSYSHRQCFRSKTRFVARPESFLAAPIIDTGDIPANTVDLLAAELAFVAGPFSAQSEYITGWIDPIAGDDASIRGVYAMLSYFLTGEHRNYLKSQGGFGPITPRDNFLRTREESGALRRGPGAWEVKYRYSYLDALDGGRIDGGRAGNHGVGLNWYLNRSARVMVEYISSTIHRPPLETDGHLHIFQVRTQLEF